MATTEHRDESAAPSGCRDPRLWAIAHELLTIHDDEGCDVCPRGAPCSLVVATAEAQDRAMRSFTERWSSGNDEYAGGRVHRGRLVGDSLVRRCLPVTLTTWLRRKRGR